jgi:hypothetical protein
MPGMPPPWFAAGLGLVLGACTACDEQRVDVSREFPPPRLAAAPRSPQGSARYEAVSSSELRFSLRDAHRRVSGRVPVKQGWLSLDTANLRSLRGRLSFALPGLELSESALGIDTAAALSVLEVNSTAPARREASFDVTSVLSAGTPALQRGGESQADEVRYVADLRVRGDLNLHGFRAEQEVTLKLVLGFDSNAAPGSAPTFVEFRSEAPFSLPLARYGLGVREAGSELWGKLLNVAALNLEARFIPNGSARWAAGLDTN